MWVLEKKRKRCGAGAAVLEPKTKKACTKKPKAKKNKQKVALERKRMTVTDYIDMKRQVYVKELQDRKVTLEKEMCCLMARLPTLTQRYQYRERLDALERRQVIETELEDIQYGVYLTKFDELVAPYYKTLKFIDLEPGEVNKTTILKVHSQQVAAADAQPTTSTTTSTSSTNVHHDGNNKSVVLQDAATTGEMYEKQVQQELQSVLQDNNTVMKVYMSNCDMCPKCQKPLVIMSAGAIMGCTQCKQTQTFIQATSSRIAYGEEVEFTSFSYRRENHFQEWLNCFQGKESTKVNQDIVDAVKDKCAELGLTDPSRIQIYHVRDALKVLGLSKYYENQQQITTRISEVPPPTMTPHQEEQVRNMFSAIIPFFEKHKPENRRNFLSYAYCLYKFCELMGWDQFLQYFSLLKGRDKLKKQDMIFKLICEDLDWEFIPSVDEDDEQLESNK